MSGQMTNCLRASLSLGLLLTNPVTDIVELLLWYFCYTVSQPCAYRIIPTTALSGYPPFPWPPLPTHAYRKYQKMTDSETEVVFVFSFFSLASAYGHPFCLSIGLSVITVNQRALRLYSSVFLAGTAAADVGAWDKMDFPLPRAAFLALMETPWNANAPPLVLQLSSIVMVGKKRKTVIPTEKNLCQPLENILCWSRQTGT